MRPTASYAWLLHLLGELGEMNWLPNAATVNFAMDDSVHQWELCVGQKSVANHVDAEKITTSSLAKT